MKLEDIPELIEKVNSVLSMDQMINKDNQAYVQRSRRSGKLGDCCSNSQKDHCVYDPCCQCLNNVSIREKKGKTIEYEQADLQCRIKMGVQEQMEYHYRSLRR